MALKGTLKDFSVADIFQLIGQQGKSGSLYIRRPDEEAHIVFDDGKVVLGTFKKGHEDLLLGTMLLNGGAITADQLEEAMNSQRVSMRSVGDILRGMKAISTETLSEFIGLQLKEVLFRLFQWTNGLYEFVPGKLKFNKNIIKPQSAEGVLMDGFRMLDEWPAIEQKVVSTDSVFKSLADPSDLVSTENKPESKESGDDDLDLNLDAAFGDFEESEPKEKKPTSSKLSAQERLVLRLMDGERTLQIIGAMSRFGTFETCRTVAELLDKGLCVRLDQASISPLLHSKKITVQDSFSKWLGDSLKPLILVAVLSISMPLFAFALQSHFRNLFKGIPTKGGKVFYGGKTMNHVVNTKRKEDIEQMLGVYQLRETDRSLAPEAIGAQEWLKEWRFKDIDGQTIPVLRKNLSESKG